MDWAQLRADLVQYEGLRLRPYRDSRGFLTIGVGRNLDAKGLSLSEVDVLLDNDMADVVHGLTAALPWLGSLTEPRQRVLANMAFNLGVDGLLGFHRMLAAAHAGDWETAKAEMLNSRWATQVGQRATDLAALWAAG